MFCLMSGIKYFLMLLVSEKAIFEMMSEARKERIKAFHLLRTAWEEAER